MSNANQDGFRDRFQWDGNRIAEEAIKRRESGAAKVTFFAESDYYTTYELLRFEVSDERFGKVPDYTAKVWAKIERSKGHLTKPKPSAAVTVEILRPDPNTLPEGHVFKTREELFAAQSDPRYQRDMKYTLWVWDSLDRSSANLWPREMR